MENAATVPMVVIRLQGLGIAGIVKNVSISGLVPGKKQDGIQRINQPHELPRRTLYRVRRKQWLST